jgi:hypothetical protein
MPGDGRGMATFCSSRLTRGALAKSVATAGILLSIAVGASAGNAADPRTATAYGETPAVSLTPAGTARASRITDRTRARQQGPVLVVAGDLHTEHPNGAGVVTLRLDDNSHRLLGSAYPGLRGIFSFVFTLAGAVPGPKQFTLSFRPYDTTRYAAATSTVSVDMLTPIEYPFARATQDRKTTSADLLPSLWADGEACSKGCRPVGAIDGWPLKPFHRQHALRAGLDEHRPSGFHVGIDIQAKDWSPVYAIQSGRAHVLDSKWPDARVQVGNYIYWHIHPAVHDGQRVIPYDTVLGHVLRSMGHLHLSEVDSAGHWLNPLRPGGRVLAPYRDSEPPVIGLPHIAPDGSVTVEAFDPQSFRVQTRYITPVLAPAGLAYRLWHQDGAPAGPLEWALRATHVLDASLSSLVFTPAAHEPGYFCFAEHSVCKPIWQYRLAGGLAPRLDLARDHGDRLTIYAWDYAGNTTARDVQL